MNKYQYYRGKYFIVFYDKADENLLYTFDNIREILAFQKKDITRKNISLISVELCRALKREQHSTEMLTGQKMKVYIVDMKEE